MKLRNGQNISRIHKKRVWMMDNGIVGLPIKFKTMQSSPISVPVVSYMKIPPGKIPGATYSCFILYLLGGVNYYLTTAPSGVTLTVTV